MFHESKGLNQIQCLRCKQAGFRTKRRITVLSTSNETPGSLLSMSTKMKTRDQDAGHPKVRKQLTGHPKARKQPTCDNLSKASRTRNVFEDKHYGERMLLGEAPSAFKKGSDEPRGIHAKRSITDISCQCSALPFHNFVTKLGLLHILLYYTVVL